MPDHSRETARRFLADSLTRRMPTWAVAEQILRLDLPGMTETLRDELAELAEHSGWGETMSSDYDRVDPADTQLRVFSSLFPQIPAPADVAADPQQLTVLIRRALDECGAGAYESAEAALVAFRDIDASASTLSRGALRKRLRFLRRLEQKTARVADSLRLRHAQMQAKSRFAYRIDADACDDATLAFCAYLAARANRRSVFQLGEQSRAQDTISDALEQLLRDNPTTNWEQVAYVKPTKSIIQRLNPAARGRLIGLFHAALTDAADALADLYPQLPVRMREEMVMVRGIDSSRWNAFAGALNTMRSAWISAVLAAGLDEILDRYCPGKAPRLMASDLVWTYREAGRDLHLDTVMFNALPRPWDVIHGDATQTRDDVLTAAERLGIDATATGWAGPRAPQDRERPQPEPALVHGVVVADPQLAATLRRCGVFSGKTLRHVDELPSALLVGATGDDTHLTPVVIDYEP